MARLLLQRHETELKPIYLSLVILAVVGCKQQSAPAVGASGQTPLTQKLQSMTPEQRTEYAKTHMDEFRNSASLPVIPAKKP